MNILGTIATHSDLHAICRAQANRLGISRNDIDALGGFPRGYASKLLAPKPIKRIGSKTLEFLLPALGIKLLAVADEESLARIRSKGFTYNANQVRDSGVVLFQLSKRFMAKIGRKGGAKSRSNLPLWRVKQLARKAGRLGAAARWSRAKAGAASPSARSPAAPRKQGADSVASKAQGPLRLPSTTAKGRASQAQ